MSVDQYIEDLDSEVKQIVTELRKIILDLFPDVDEQIKWKVPTYALGKNFCSIMAHKKHVNVQLFQGAHIKDVHLLSGTGKDMRHFKYTKPEEIKQAELEACLKQAADLAN